MEFLVWKTHWHVNKLFSFVSKLLSKALISFITFETLLISFRITQGTSVDKNNPNVWRISVRDEIVHESVTLFVLLKNLNEFNLHL